MSLRTEPDALKVRDKQPDSRRGTCLVSPYAKSRPEVEERLLRARTTAAGTPLA